MHVVLLGAACARCARSPRQTRSSPTPSRSSSPAGTRSACSEYRPRHHGEDAAQRHVGVGELAQPRHVARARLGRVAADGLAADDGGLLRRVGARDALERVAVGDRLLDGRVAAREQPVRPQPLGQQQLEVGRPDRRAARSRVGFSPASWPLKMPPKVLRGWQFFGGSSSCREARSSPGWSVESGDASPTGLETIAGFNRVNGSIARNPPGPVRGATA